MAADTIEICLRPHLDHGRLRLRVPRSSIARTDLLPALARVRSHHVISPGAIGGTPALITRSHLYASAPQRLRIFGRDVDVDQLKEARAFLWCRRAPAPTRSSSVSSSNDRSSPASPQLALRVLLDARVDSLGERFASLIAPAFAAPVRRARRRCRRDTRTLHRSTPPLGARPANSSACVALRSCGERGIDRGIELGHHFARAPIADVKQTDHEARSRVARFAASFSAGSGGLVVGPAFAYTTCAAAFGSAQARADDPIFTPSRSTIVYWANAGVLGW
jgi:hypothetical protein